MISKAHRSGSRHSETPFFHVGQGLERSGATRIDLRRWAYVGLAVILLGLVGWLYLEQASEVASYGYEIRQLENRKERLRRELTALRAEVAMQGSLERIYAAGNSLGYSMPAADDSARRLAIEYVMPPPSPETDSSARGAAATVEGAGVASFLRGLLGGLGGGSAASMEDPE